MDIKQKKNTCLSPLKNQRGFTLVELLTVVAIIAIIGGGMIAAYDGLEGRAATGGATGSLASIDQAVRTFAVTEEGLPTNVEALMVATPPASPTCDAATGDSEGDPTGGYAHAQMLQAKLDSGGGKTAVLSLTDAMITNLVASGIKKVRFLDAGAENPASLPFDTNIPDANCGDASISGQVSEIDIPQHAFEAPRPGASGKNRGRGWGVTLIDANGDARTAASFAGGLSLLEWNSGGGYNNVKVGASKSAQLVVLGIGNASSIVGAGNVTNLAHAPYYGKVNRNEYNHYSMLVDVSQNPARFVGMIDARGDFLDEEYAETTGQKS